MPNPESLHGILSISVTRAKTASHLSAFHRDTTLKPINTHLKRTQPTTVNFSMFISGTSASPVFARLRLEDVEHLEHVSLLYPTPLLVSGCSDCHQTGHARTFVNETTSYICTLIRRNTEERKQISINYRIRHNKKPIKACSMMGLIMRPDLTLLWSMVLYLLLLKIFS
ncbi:hypothetical protein DPEC_G00241740 [Dallia pectoralis]|uniref:Uncharacterized protein n=1 Tax=Dallia pectoralis TaxID=75939 RepID=A0ACC2FV24_DALPE|nr:hypothetical protein DPEC_G00241740 [Dallia pectoralis]